MEKEKKNGMELVVNYRSFQRYGGTLIEGKICHF